MAEKQIPPTNAIIEACDEITAIISAYLKALESAKMDGRFEALLEVYSSLKLLTRYAESIIALAKEDLVFLPSANVIARSFLETGYRAAWFLSPVDPFEREVRWLRYLDSAIEHYLKLGESHLVPADLRDTFNARGLDHQTFAAKLHQLLDKEGYPVPKKKLRFQEIVDAGIFGDCYHFFILLSAYTHSNFAALEIYRRNLGCGKELGEFIKVSDWTLPLGVTGLLFYRVANEFLRNVDVDVTRVFPDSLATDFSACMDRLSSG